LKSLTASRPVFFVWPMPSLTKNYTVLKAPLIVLAFDSSPRSFCKLIDATAASFVFLYEIMLTIYNTIILLVKMYF